MKNLRIVLILVLIASVASLSFGQTAEKVLVKSFNLKGKDVIVLDLEGEVEVQQWKNDIMRVQMTVALTNRNSTTLKSLIRAGRYNLKSKVDNDACVVYAPGMQRDIRIKGQELKENISFVVYAPENVIVKVGTETSAAKTSADQMPSTL
ncbi:MAG: hypothetical protein AAFP19_18780 [Bacteroidota bacterium]